jgi:hypothetical protein
LSSTRPVPRGARDTEGEALGIKEGENHYRPMCIHYLHLGWLGVTANFRYYEMFDFVAGWFGFDPVGDDRKTAPSALVEAEPEGLRVRPLRSGDGPVP